MYATLQQNPIFIRVATKHWFVLQNTLIVVDCVYKLQQALNLVLVSCHWMSPKPHRLRNVLKENRGFTEREREREREVWWGRGFIG